MCLVPMITNIFHLVVIAASIISLEYQTRLDVFSHRESFWIIWHHRFKEFSMEDKMYLIYRRQM